MASRQPNDSSCDVCLMLAGGPCVRSASNKCSFRSRSQWCLFVFVSCLVLASISRSLALGRCSVVAVRFPFRRFGRSSASTLVNPVVPAFAFRFHVSARSLVALDLVFLGSIGAVQQQLRCPAGLPAARPAERRCLQRPGLLSSSAFFAPSSSSSFLSTTSPFLASQSFPFSSVL